MGHSVYHDFEALDIQHPCHMVRDTSTTRLLSRLAGFPRERCASLKILAQKLLDRRIQVSQLYVYVFCPVLYLFDVNVSSYD